MGHAASLYSLTAPLSPKKGDGEREGNTSRSCPYSPSNQETLVMNTPTYYTQILVARSLHGSSTTDHGLKEDYTLH